MTPNPRSLTERRNAAMEWVLIAFCSSAYIFALVFETCGGGR